MKKFSVLIDLDRLKDLNTGLGQVAEFFGNEISRTKDDSLKFTLLVPKQFVGYFGTNVEYEVVSLKRQLFPSLCRKYDLWYTIHQDSFYFPSSRQTPYVITINDLNFLGEKTPQKAALRLRRLQKKVDRAAAITVISQFTESVVRENLNTGSVPIHVIYCGVHVKTYENVPKPSYVPEGDVLFSVGVIQKKKNLEVLIPFMKLLPENYKLVCAGNKKTEYADFLQKEIGDLGLTDRIILPGLISEEDKFWLYKNCKAVLFPSKFEGMGFPPVEAMRFGKPVFASTWSSIPEVSGDNAYYWDNFEPEYMSKLFLSNIDIFNKDPLKPEILRKHSMKYTWEANRIAYLELFKKMLAVE